MAIDPFTAKLILALLQYAAQSAPSAPPSPQHRAPEGIAEVGEAVIKCYHPTGKFRTVDVAELPWSRGHQYNAEKSVLLVITWDGLVHRGYRTQVALIVRRGEMRGVVVQDSAGVPASRSCSLERWSKVANAEQSPPAVTNSPISVGLRVPQESLRFRRETEGGVPVLVLSGEIVNQSDKPQRLAPMRILLLDNINQVLRTERVRIDDRTLDPGKRLPFQASIPNAPPEAAAVRINFDSAER